MKLNDLKIGDVGIIKKLKADKNIKQRLLDIGLVKGLKIYPVLKNKGMIAYNIKGAIIAVRKEDTKDIVVEKAL